jgi:hypothetical protein
MRGSRYSTVPSHENDDLEWQSDDDLEPSIVSITVSRQTLQDGSTIKVKETFYSDGTSQKSSQSEIRQQDGRITMKMRPNDTIKTKTQHSAIDTTAAISLPLSTNQTQQWQQRRRPRRQKSSSPFLMETRTTNFANNNTKYMPLAVTDHDHDDLSSAWKIISVTTSDKLPQSRLSQSQLCRYLIYKSCLFLALFLLMVAAVTLGVLVYLWKVEDNDENGLWAWIQHWWQEQQHNF